MSFFYSCLTSQVVGILIIMDKKISVFLFLCLPTLFPFKVSCYQVIPAYLLYRAIFHSIFSGETIYSHPSQIDELNNYYYNRPSIIRKRKGLFLLYYTSLKLLSGGFSSAEIQFLSPKPIFMVFYVFKIFFSAVII